MTGRIKDILKQYPPLTDKYISEGSLEEQMDTYAIIPDGKDYAARKYTDGSQVRRMRFKVLGRLKDGLGFDIDNLRFMQGISDYLCHREYPDGDIIGFEQISPPVMEGRAVYAFLMECVYCKCKM